MRLSHQLHQLVPRSGNWQRGKLDETNIKLEMSYNHVQALQNHDVLEIK